MQTYETNVPEPKVAAGLFVNEERVEVVKEVEVEEQVVITSAEVASTAVVHAESENVVMFKINEADVWAVTMLAKLRPPLEVVAMHTPVAVSMAAVGVPEQVEEARKVCCVKKPVGPKFEEDGTIRPNVLGLSSNCFLFSIISENIFLSKPCILPRIQTTTKMQANSFDIILYLLNFFGYMIGYRKSVLLLNGYRR